MGRMEVITRTERQRTYSEAEKAAVVAQASVPGVTVQEVSRRIGIAESSSTTGGRRATEGGEHRQ